MKRLLVLGLTLASTALWGMDMEGRFSTQGARSCGQYVEAARDKKISLGYAATEAWVAGYITAYNSETRDTYDILGASDLKSAMLWLENWCNSNPLRNMGDAMQSLTAELHPRRHRSAKDARR